MTRLASLTNLTFAVTFAITSSLLSAQQTQPAEDTQGSSAATLPQGHPPLPSGHPQITDQPTTPRAYETTEVEPPWRVAMRHLIVRRMDRYLHVTEVWAINNPTDLSYIGAPVEPPKPGAGEAQPNIASNPDRVTMVLPLPAGATQVQPGPEFHTCCVRVEGDKLISKMPMLPGTTEFRVDYLLPPKDGAFNLVLATPVQTGHLMIFLPDDGSQVTAQGLKTGDPFEAGEQRYRMYTAKQVKPGAVTGLVIQVGQAVMQSKAGASASISQAGTIKIITGGGVGLLVLAGAFVLLRPTKKPRPTGEAA